MLRIQVITRDRYLCRWTLQLPVVHCQTTDLEGGLANEQIEFPHATEFFS